MTDLFTPTMPAELAEKLTAARLELRRTADEIDTELERFFEEAWAECHRTHEVQMKDAVVTVKGTPDFNAFDRFTGRYSKAVSKLRWLLWDIDAAADPQGAEQS